MRAFDPKATYHPYVWVTGEITDVSRARSGHIYFSLVDRGTQIPAVLWERVARGIPVHVQNGLSVAAYGWVQKHPERSHLEFDVRDLVVHRLRGPRQDALRDLQERLRREGLMDPARKRPLPHAPKSIGIVTSPTSDVLHDIQRILQRRAPDVRTELSPARVSGGAATEEIAGAIQSLSESGSVDLVILARGGGSAVDLAPFDSEIVARAITSCRVPVISAIGHETDVTIADMVADLRCATPSEAAEMAVPERTTRAAANDLEISSAGRATELRLQLGAVSVVVHLPISASAAADGP
jgi:exodeoxyribonuclease VII large subunit